MGSTDDLLSYRELIGEVRRVCTQRLSGCVFITTSENYAVRFELQNGTIVAVHFRQQTGLDAIVSIQRITAGRLKYSDQVLRHEPQAGLPSTSELLMMLDSTSVRAIDERPANAAAANGRLARNRGVIELELAEYVGPIAQVLCREQIALATDVDDLIERLARELRDAGKTAHFKERVRHRLATSNG